jgi:hypothetical protein
MGRLNFRIELDVISATAPDVARVAQQIVHLIYVALHLAELIDRYIDISTLFAMRIEIDDDENDIVASGSHFAVKQNGVVIGAVKSQVIVKLECSVFLSNLVQPRDPVLDISRSVPIPFFPLILFGIEILLTSRQGLVLAQLISAVDAIKS